MSGLNFQSDYDDTQKTTFKTGRWRVHMHMGCFVETIRHAEWLKPLYKQWDPNVSDLQHSGSFVCQPLWDNTFSKKASHQKNMCNTLILLSFNDSPPNKCQAIVFLAHRARDFCAMLQVCCSERHIHFHCTGTAKNHLNASEPLGRSQVVQSCYNKLLVEDACLCNAYVCSASLCYTLLRACICAGTLVYV